MGGSATSQQSFRWNMSLCARREIHVCLRRENAAVVLPEHVSLRTERDPTVLVACERSSLSHEHVFLLVHGEKSKCARGVRWHMSLCARSEIQVSSRREQAAVFRWNLSLCARREIQVCSWRASAAVLLHEHLCVPNVRMEMQVAGIPLVLAQQCYRT